MARIDVHGMRPATSSRIDLGAEALRRGGCAPANVRRVNRLTSRWWCRRERRAHDRLARMDEIIECERWPWSRPQAPARTWHLDAGHTHLRHMHECDQARNAIPFGRFAG